MKLDEFKLNMKKAMSWIVKAPYIYDIVQFVRYSKTSISYSTSGEDAIVMFILDHMLKVENPTYLEIGSFHPMSGSNTYAFYRRGNSGVCVEPDPELFAQLKKHRRRDICLNLGIGNEEKVSDFYIMNPRTMNTFSKEHAEYFEKHGNSKIERKVPVKIVPINTVLLKHFSKSPNFVSIDVEGWDYEVLKDWDFSQFRPEVFCIETYLFSEQKKDERIMKLMEENGYRQYADTFTNSIFVDRKKW